MKNEQVEKMLELLERIAKALENQPKKVQVRDVQVGNPYAPAPTYIPTTINETLIVTPTCFPNSCDFTHSSGLFPSYCSNCGRSSLFSTFVSQAKL